MASTLQKESVLTLCKEVAQPDQLKFFESGTKIVSPGDVGNYVYVIKSGIFKLGIDYKKTPLTIEFLFSGYITGLLNLHQTVNYPCFIQSLTKSSVYVWERAKILELMKIMPDFSIEFQKSYSNWGLKVVERLKNLVFLAPYQRIASWVYDYSMSNSYRLNKIWSALSVKDMAEFCNVSEIDFKNAINELVRSGIVYLSEKDIHVRDWNKLNFIINS